LFLELMHDRAGRMLAKGVVRAEPRWKTARRFFYWRLRRRLTEDRLLDRLAHAAPAVPAVPRNRHRDQLAAWCAVEGFESADRAVAEWVEANVEKVGRRVDAARREQVRRDVGEMWERKEDVVVKALRERLGMMPVSEREEPLKVLARP
jgi:acetyl-CoA carboxylase / biotin carboxylase 1